MNNQQLIKSALIGFVAVLLACGLWVIAGIAGTMNQNQNSNQNSNSNVNTKAQNENASTANQNTATPAATGEKTAMANMSSDQAFVMDTAMDGMVEVELGRWAKQKGTTDAVKQFGQRMVDDHTKANDELKTLASSKGITLPTQIDEKHRKDMTKITSLSGASFDRAYSKMMAKDHAKAVAAFEGQSTKGTDADLKAFASKTLPTLQEHLQMARSLAGEGTGNTKSNTSNKNVNGNSNQP
jgi:putative membrane protein